MLRFNNQPTARHNIGTWISIHLMLRFNERELLEEKWGLGISIHLMLRFNPLAPRIWLYNSNFNTSYVTVQLLRM